MAYAPADPMTRLLFVLAKVIFRKGTTSKQNFDVTRYRERLVRLNSLFSSSQYQASHSLPKLLPAAFNVIPAEYKVSYSITNLGLMYFDDALNRLSHTELHFCADDFGKLAKNSNKVKSDEKAFFYLALSLLVDCKVSRRELRYEVVKNVRALRELENGVLQLLFRD